MNNRPWKTFIGVIAIGLVMPLAIAGPSFAETKPLPPDDARQLLTTLLDDPAAAEDLPTSTLERVQEIIDSGREVVSVDSSGYTTPTPADGEVGTLAYGVAPCYLTVLLSTGFGRVASESMTGCTAGAATTTLHDQDLVKRDTVFGTTSIVASDEESGGYGGFISSIEYQCPNVNHSQFEGRTGGQITYNGTIYGAYGTTGGWDDSNCG